MKKEKINRNVSRTFYDWVRSRLKPGTHNENKKHTELFYAAQAAFMSINFHILKTGSSIQTVHHNFWVNLSGGNIMYEAACFSFNSSPSELFAARSRSHKIPVRGQKDFFPNDSEEQRQRLEQSLNEHWSLISEERVERLWVHVGSICPPKSEYYHNYSFLITPLCCVQCQPKTLWLLWLCKVLKAVFTAVVYLKINDQYLLSDGKCISPIIGWT